MKLLKITFQILLLLITMAENSNSQDWANLNRFQNINDSIGLPTPSEDRIVFMGNSITESWQKFLPLFFSDKPYINRGISGQTTPQMLIRFRADVINLKPKIVVILAGTNDIAGNTGPSTLQMIMNNIVSMTELAKVNGIKVILSSVLPVFDYPWSPGLNPVEKIPTLNGLIKNYADQNNLTYLDYFSSMVDERNGLKDKYTYDGVHPNKAGYEVMVPLAEEAIAKVLTK